MFLKQISIIPSKIEPSILQKMTQRKKKKKDRLSRMGCQPSQSSAWSNKKDEGWVVRRKKEKREKRGLGKI